MDVPLCPFSLPPKLPAAAPLRFGLAVWVNNMGIRHQQCQLISSSLFLPNITYAFPGFPGLTSLSSQQTTSSPQDELLFVGIRHAWWGRQICIFATQSQVVNSEKGEKKHASSTSAFNHPVSGKEKGQEKGRDELLFVGIRHAWWGRQIY
jgi:hypothetical protein